MAQYKAPPDPRDPNVKKNNKKPDDRTPIPWLWLGLGVVVTLIGMGVAFSIVRAFLFREPLLVSPLEPTVIILTAPPSPTPPPGPAAVAPTAMPTFTPVPTPDAAVAPDEVTTGYYAQVVNTDGIGVTVRGGPSVSNVPLTVAPEGAILFVLDGPEAGGDLLWWQVRMEDGVEGWAAADFLAPAVAP
ncbi:MAG: SH3 domain-containing protein [Chloroflexi bacterium]|nr:SH3 domain-containing protein [Chloroflexota bacterium]